MLGYVLGNQVFLPGMGLSGTPSLCILGTPKKDRMASLVFSL